MSVSKQTNKNPQTQTIQNKGCLGGAPLYFLQSMAGAGSCCPVSENSGEIQEKYCIIWDEPDKYHHVCDLVHAQ